jgi:NADPH:quinone reductase-like Zn-dependent oxidoreductase
VAQVKQEDEMSNNTMQVIRAHDYGAPEVLQLEQAPIPQPQAGEVLVRLFASGVNPADWKFRSGMSRAYRPLTFPWTPGLEGAGTVEAVGEGVSAFHPGQAVYGRMAGSYAEYTVVDANALLLKPENLTYQEAAAAPVGALTAWAAVIDTAKVQPGWRVLVHGAAGGVGLFAVQLACWKGAHVIGTASTRNLEFVRSLGAEQVIDYNALRFEDVLQDMDAVIDTVGGDLPERSLKVLRRDGVFVTVAAQVTPEMGVPYGVRVLRGGRAGVEEQKQLNQLLATKRVWPVVGAVFPLAQASRAHELSQTGHGCGRIVLQIAG